MVFSCECPADPSEEERGDGVWDTAARASSTGDERYVLHAAQHIFTQVYGGGVVGCGG